MSQVGSGIRPPLQPSPCVRTRGLGPREGRTASLPGADSDAHQHVVQHEQPALFGFRDFPSVVVNGFDHVVGSDEVSVPTAEELESGHCYHHEFIRGARGRAQSRLIYACSAHHASARARGRRLFLTASVLQTGAQGLQTGGIRLPANTREAEQPR